MAATTLQYNKRFFPICSKRQIEVNTNLNACMTSADDHINFPLIEKIVGGNTEVRCV